MKKQRSFTLQKTYDFPCFKIGVKADPRIFAGLFKALEAYESANDDTDIADGLRISRCTKESFSIPDRAVRTHINHERGTSVYIFKQVRIFLFPNFAVTLRGDNGGAVLEYCNADRETLWQAEQLLRWLIHCKAFKKKLVYFPGQFLFPSLSNTGTASRSLILVTGHPECGKTACLESLKSLGANLAAPNMLITNTLKAAFSFNAGFPGKRQTRHAVLKLFPGKPELFPGSRTPANNLFLDRILIINAWGKKNSVLEKISAESCAAELSEFNKRSYEYFSQSQIEYLFGQYTKMLKGVSCRRLLLGTDRRQLRHTLGFFLNNRSGRNGK
ncbi:MAG: hypothetical protein PHS09_06335 [Candidatus Omnitrophica bacterium]|nr:hypothetical protein [Candidatus Omnitrophota bacterium]MDD5512557.1 hypothetical protein [Candidatus Omnitrophota bacterium]